MLGYSPDRSSRASHSLLRLKLAPILWNPQPHLNGPRETDQPQEAIKYSNVGIIQAGDEDSLKQQEGNGRPRCPRKWKALLFTPAQWRNKSSPMTHGIKKGKPGFGGNQAFLAFQRGPMMGVTTLIGKRKTRLQTLRAFAPLHSTVCLYGAKYIYNNYAKLKSVWCDHVTGEYTNRKVALLRGSSWVKLCEPENCKFSRQRVGGGNPEHYRHQREVCIYLYSKSSDLTMWQLA